jgi:arabinofuranan 3-O-arabinosyltransferase
MPLRSRAGRLGGLVPLVVAAGCFVLAFAQRPGRTFFDTRIELSTDPGLFLHRASQVWSSTVDLGHVQSGQFVGYLFPMGPWFAFTHAIGLPMWIAQRLWLGAVLACAAWGVVRLLDALWTPKRGLGHVAAAILYAVSPYAIVFVTRGTVTLLAYAALPWLLLATHRGMAEPHRWRWPAVAGLVFAAAGGGVNLAVLFWVGLAPVALALYEIAVRGRPKQALVSFGWRAAVCVLVASLWWIVPVLTASAHQGDFLSFTEQPESILGTPSVSESLRLLGYWVAYIGIGLDRVEPLVPAAHAYLFSPVVVAGTLAVPLLALGGARLARSWTYAPFFGILAVAGVVLMSLGFPEGTPMHDAYVWAYYHIAPLRWLRTMYKAAPLVALPLACLGGVVVATLFARARERSLTVLSTRIPAVAVAGAFAVVAALWAAPLLRRDAIDARAAYGSVPSAWTAAIRGADRSTPPDHRIMVLPGELFADYQWGWTYTSVAPALTRRPLLIREIERYAESNAAQLQWSVDDLVQQGRLFPGQLDPLLRLLGVGQVLVATDGRRVRAESIDPATLQDALLGQRGFEAPAGSYGAPRPFQPARGHGATAVTLPEILRYAAPRPTGPGIVRIHPQRGPTLLDGDADGIVTLAALGSLRPERALLYAGDQTRRSVATQLRNGAELVFSDSARVRSAIESRLADTNGPTLTAGTPIPEDWPRYDPFPRAGLAGRTVAEYTGLRNLYSPQSRGSANFPQYRPYAALDGDLRTAWIANSQVVSQRYLQLELAHPRPVAAIAVQPHSDPSGRTAFVAVSVNGGPERRVHLNAGWNRVPVATRELRTLRIRILKVVGGGLLPGQGGLDEVRIPGLRVTESLRLPVWLAGLTRGQDLRRNPITVVLQRTTADFPNAQGANDTNPQNRDLLEMLDAEPGLSRTVTLPERRGFQADGWASIAPQAPDDAIDRLLGLRARGWTFTASGRFEGLPIRRASSAFDGDPRTAWIGDWTDGRDTWVAARMPRVRTVRELRLRPAGRAFRFPSVVAVETPTGPLEVRVAPSGLVRLPHAIRVQTIRLDIRRLAQATPYQRERALRAVGIADVQVPGIDPPRPPRTGVVRSRCGAVVVQDGASQLPLEATGSVAELEQGQPAALQGCGRPLLLPAGSSHLAAGGSILRPDALRLRSAAPGGPATAPASAGRVVDLGHGGLDGAHDRIRLALDGPAWLVLGESFSPEWSATCADAQGHERELGKPQTIDGYANGWRVGPWCRTASISYSPQSAATGAVVASLVGGAALLALAVWGFVPAVRRRLGGGVVPPSPAETAADVGAPEPQDTVRVASWTRTIVLAGAALGVGGIFFGWRGGALLAALTVVFGRSGWSARRLFTAGALGLAAVVALYLLHPVADAGFNFGYSTGHIAAHYAAVGALACIATAFLIDARRLRRRRRPTRATADGASGNGDGTLALAEAAHADGWLTDSQALRLWECAGNVRAGGVIVEIGSFRGRSAIVLAKGAAADVDVVAVDPHAGNDRGPGEIAPDAQRGSDDHEVFHRNLARAGVADRVRHVRLRSNDALAVVKAPLDLLYVDGAHRYSQARDDLRLWGPRVRRDGTLLVHDAFSSVGVTLAIGRTLLASGEFRYRGRDGSLARYTRERLSPAARAGSSLRQLAQLPYFVRNLLIKVLIVARLGRLSRLLGQRQPSWPY